MFKDIKLSKRSHMSKSKTAGLGRRFTKKLDTMRFTHNDMNFDVIYENHQNWSKTYLWTFWGFFMTLICDIKIDFWFSQLLKGICVDHLICLWFGCLYKMGVHASESRNPRATAGTSQVVGSGGSLESLMNAVWKLIVCVLCQLRHFKGCAIFNTWQTLVFQTCHPFQYCSSLDYFSLNWVQCMNRYTHEQLLLPPWETKPDSSHSPLLYLGILVSIIGETFKTYYNNYCNY